MHRNEGSEHEGGQELIDSDDDTPSACEDGRDTAPQNRVVSQLVQQCCDLILQWRETISSQHQLSENQRK